MKTALGTLVLSLALLMTPVAASADDEDLPTSNRDSSWGCGGC